MQVQIHPDAEAAGRAAAGIVQALVEEDPSAVLGLTPGSTPRRLYEILADDHQAGAIDLSRITVFAPGEFVGVRPGHRGSWCRDLREHFLDRIGLQESRVHLLDGLAEDPADELRRFERTIETSGGIDLMLVGIGSDGHVAFNDPGCSLSAGCRVVPVTLDRRGGLAEAFGGEAGVPERAMTIGLGTVREARRVLVMATGEGKAEAVAGMVEGPVTASNPASALQLCPEVVAVLDEAAASRLRFVDHYREAQARGGGGRGVGGD